MGAKDPSAITAWAREDEGFHTMYARAREIQADMMADDLIKISDDGSNDWMERQIADGVVVPIVDHEHIARSRLRVDTRKWLMSKMMPKKYGDKLTVDGSVNHVVTHELSDKELERIAAKDNTSDGGSRIIEAEEMPPLPVRLVN